MATLKLISGKPRIRFWLTFPDGIRWDRSKRFNSMRQAKAKLAIAREIEELTEYQSYLISDIEGWLREKLISRDDAKRLGHGCRAKVLKQAVEDYRQSWECGLKEAEAREARCERIIEILGENTPVHQLEYSDGLRLRKELRSVGYKVANIQKFVQDLKRMMRIQVANRTVGFNVFSDLPDGRIPEEEKLESRALTPGEIADVIAKAEESPFLGDNLKFVLLFFLGTGLRRGEALSARWEWIDWDERSLELPASVTKNRKTRKVGLGQRLYYELLVRKQDEGFILPRFAPWSISRVVREHLGACGIKARLHDARHTYATLIQDIGARPHEAMARTGHSDMRILSRYSHAKFGKVIEDELEFLKTPKGCEPSA